MAIVYRTTGAWGAGTGVDLDADVIDNNFYSLHLRVLDIEENPPQAVSIDHFVIEGSLLTIVMTDASEHGPFVLPIGQWRWTGEWADATTYFLGDLFTESGNIYMVRVQHISAATFDPDLFTIDGQVYQLILPRATHTLSLNFYNRDLIGEGEEILHQFVADRTFTITANFDGSQAYLRVATSTTTIACPVFLNGAVVGSIVFVPTVDTDAQGGQYGTFHPTTADTDIDVVARDIIAFGQPYDADDTAAGLTVSISATIAGVT